MKNNYLILSAVSCFLLTSFAFAGPVTGKINNVAWTFLSGIAERKGENLQIKLWNQSFENPCTQWQGSVFDARAIFPAQVATFRVNPNSFSQNVIVMGDNRHPGNPENNIFANTGTMKITQITETEVRGTLTAAYPPKRSSLSGDFVVPLCVPAE